MSNNYFIGDLHLGHENILKYRNAFDSIDDHDNSIQDDRYINVSCDAIGFKPIDLNGIRAIMESQNL